MEVYINDSSNALAIYDNNQLQYLCNYFDYSDYSYLHACYTLGDNKAIREYCSDYETLEGNELLDNPSATIPNLNDWLCIFH